MMPATIDQWFPDQDGLTAAFMRLARQVRSMGGADPAMACLGAVMRRGPIRVSQLADELLLDASTTSRQVRQLETAGLLARAPDPEDQRATLLTVTPHGLDYLRDGMHRRFRAVRAATADWPESDLATLTTLLNRLADDVGTIVDSGEKP
jgi:DNA-binding MarR family transcriptional regulator